MRCAVGLAQLVEGFTAKQEVAGSVPVVRPILRVFKRYCLLAANG